MNTKIAMVITFVIGLILGYSLTSNYYQHKMLGEAQIYKEQVAEARTKEREWQQKAYELDNEYKEKINSIQSNNDALVARLRQQLSDASRVSSNCQSSSQSNGNSKQARISEEIRNLVDFSHECARDADKLSIQLDSLQNWIIKTK